MVRTGSGRERGGDFGVDVQAAVGGGGPGVVLGGGRAVGSELVGQLGVVAHLGHALGQ